MAIKRNLEEENKIVLDEEKGPLHLLANNNIGVSDVSRYEAGLKSIERLNLKKESE